jgi:hypothetical protein
LNSIISLLVLYNQFLLSQIHQLLVFIAKNIPLESKKYDVNNPKYKKFTVDKLPIIEKLELLNYKKLLSSYTSWTSCGISVGSSMTFGNMTFVRMSRYFP